MGSLPRQADQGLCQWRSVTRGDEQRGRLASGVSASPFACFGRPCETVAWVDSTRIDRSDYMSIVVWSPMAMVKATFSLAPETIVALSDAADRLSRSKSEIVRDAILDYHARVDRLGSAERVCMLEAFDKFPSSLSARSDEDVDRELKEIRPSRHSGGRLSRTERSCSTPRSLLMPWRARNGWGRPCVPSSQRDIE